LCLLVRHHPLVASALNSHGTLFSGALAYATCTHSERILGLGLEIRQGAYDLSQKFPKHQL
jgi:hypothetical protein